MVVKKIYRTFWAAALSAAVCGANAAGLEVVQADSQYFQNWIFTEYTWTAAPPIPQITIPAQTDNSLISLAGRPLTVRVEAQNTGDIFRVWPNGLSSFAGSATLPANIARPSAPAQVAMNRGTASFMFTQPLPRGSTFFFSDFDSSEVFEYRFVDCGGNLVDAADFTFLQVSLPSATNPPAWSIQGTAPERYWRVAAVTAGNDPNSTNGIVIESDAVCGVLLQGTRPGANGSVNYSFGLPRAALLTMVKSVAGINGMPRTAPLQPGDTVEYAITLTNSQTFDITLPAGYVQDTLPAHTTLVSSADFICTGTACASQAQVTVPAGGSVSLRLQVRVEAVDPQVVTAIANTAAVTGLSCAAAGNQCSVSTPLSQPAPVPVNTPWILALLAVLLAFSARVQHGRTSRA